MHASILYFFPLYQTILNNFVCCLDKELNDSSFSIVVMTVVLVKQGIQVDNPERLDLCPVMRRLMDDALAKLYKFNQYVLCRGVCLGNVMFSSPFKKERKSNNGDTKNCTSSRTILMSLKYARGLLSTEGVIWVHNMKIYRMNLSEQVSRTS